MSEAILIGGYSAVLLLTAVLMDRVASSLHERIDQTKTIGFRYHAHLNAWQCSEGTFLWHHETDASARVIRFRAKAEICNACSLKRVCTDSDDGRTLTRPLDRWPHSEMARFQRVISLTLILLAALLCAVEIVRQGDAGIQASFGAGAMLSAVLARREWRRVRAVRTALFG